MAQKNKLRIRFTLNHSKGASDKSIVELRRATNSFASVVLDDVGIEYAKNQLSELRTRTAARIERVVHQEILHLTNLYKRFIVGKTQVGRGTLTTQTRSSQDARSGARRPADSFYLSRALPGWAARKKKYLDRKQREKQHTRWFEYGGLLEKAMTPDNWLSFFGPVFVTVRPTRPQTSSRSTATTTAFSSSAHMDKKERRYGVARIGVGVFGSLTPSMLSALADGDMSAANQTQDGRKSGLLGLVAAKNPALAHHLGGDSRYTPYRPTLEPFLAFAITRSLPAAIFNRLGSDGFRYSEVNSREVR